MRLLVACAIVLGGCARGVESRTASSATVASVPETARAPEAVAVEAPAAAATTEAAPRSRPRLSQTVTLGQSSPDADYSAAGAPPPAAAQGAPNVVINNNVIVQHPPAMYGGYGYGYGYGYGSRGGGVSRDGFGGRASGSQWGTNGWEGARRTAAPGQTPGIGGNWSPPRSYGPAQMK